MKTNRKFLKVIRKTLKIDVVNFCEVEVTMIFKVSNFNNYHSKPIYCFLCTSVPFFPR